MAIETSEEREARIEYKEEARTEKWLDAVYVKEDACMFDYSELEDTIFNRIWRCNEVSGDTARYYAQIAIQEMKKIRHEEEKAS